MSDPDFRLIPRLSTDAERRQLKAMTQQALSVVGTEAFTPVTRVEKAACSKYGGIAYPDHFIPADVMLELDRQAGAPLLTATLARMQGYRLVRDEDEDAETLQLADVQAIAKETGDVVNLLLTLLTSGKQLDAADRRDILKEVVEAKASLYRMASKVHGSAG